MSELASRRLTCHSPECLAGKIVSEINDNFLNNVTYTRNTNVVIAMPADVLFLVCNTNIKYFIDQLELMGMADGLLES